MKRYGLNILGISKTPWKGQGDIVSNDMRMVYSGGERCKRGVAILFDKEAAERITRIEKISDRLMMVKVSAEPVDIVLIQVGLTFLFSYYVFYLVVYLLYLLIFIFRGWHIYLY